MWDALNEEERDWILAAQQSDFIDVHEAAIHKSLDSLQNKGLFKRAEKNTKLRLFSDAFSSFIKEHVKALENDYEEIERRIREGYINFGIEDIKSTLEHLNRLKAEWKKREKKSSVPDKTYVKCDRLSLIFQSLYSLIVLMSKSGKGATGTNSRRTALVEKIDKNLNNLAGYFEEFEWFGEKGVEVIDLHSGKRLLDQLVDLLKEHEKQQIFGNGFDRILSARINFMKNHGWEQFKEFRQEVEDAFDRLIGVYDYSRAGQILQIKQSKPMEELSNAFFSRPLTTIFTIIVVPFFLNNLLIESLRDRVANPGYLNLLWIWVAACHLCFIWAMYKGTISEKFCRFPESKKLFRKAVFPGTLLVTALGVVVCMLTVNSFDELPGDIADKPYIVLLGAVIAGIFSLIFVLVPVKRKVISFKIALRRAEYFCGVEYLKAFWLVMMISVLLYVFSLILPSLGELNVLDNIAKASGRERLYPNRIDFLGLPMNFLVVLSLSFFAPLVGALKFAGKK
jgi:hypothetical protein